MALPLVGQETRIGVFSLLQNKDVTNENNFVEEPREMISETPIFTSLPLQMVVNIYIDWQYKFIDGFDHDKTGTFTDGICPTTSVTAKSVSKFTLPYYVINL